MKHIKSYLLIIITLFLISGCSDDFLDIKPQAVSTEESFYSTFAAVDQTVTAAYAELCARDIMDIHYSLALGCAAADDFECGGENTSDWPEIQNFDRLIHTKNDAANPEDFYRYQYKGIRMCNTALERLAGIKEMDPKAKDQDIAKRTAEMKFMRALYHFQLVQVFGGVPIAAKTIGPNDFETPRNKIKEVFEFIELDLKDAIPVLPEKKNLGQEKGRASKGAAQALLSRMLIYESGYAKNYPGDSRFAGCQQRWQEALDYAQAVINATDSYWLVGSEADPDPESVDPVNYKNSWWGTPNGQDFIAPYAEGQKEVNAYRWLFTVDGDNSGEAIFEVQSVQDGLGWGYTRGNTLTVYQTCRKYTSKEGEILDAGGWSFNMPTQYLVDAFRNADSRESSLHSLPGNETDDPRFAVTVGRLGDTIRVKTTWQKMNLDNLPTGMIGRKFECGNEEYWKKGRYEEGPFNIRLMRLADLLLLAAEAAIMMGDEPTARNYVNQVRSRARRCGTTGFPQDLTAVSFEDIVHERRLELALEPHRFFDLVRWGLAEQFVSGINLAAYPGFTVVFEKGKHEFWPLPVSEVELSKGALVQYPAWE